MTAPASARRLAQAVFAVALAVGLWVALRPAVQSAVVPWDKAQHFLAFWAFAGLGAAALSQRPLWAPTLILALYGALIEVGQSLPAIHRDADVMDWVADMLGVAACYLPLLLGPWRRWTRSG